jgi:hypothetical protein
MSTFCAGYQSFGSSRCTQRCLVADFEVGTIPGEFDAAVVYDALHHADSEAAVIKNIFNAPVPGGMLITIEPGRGHSTSQNSIATVTQYGTTEKDMPYSLQKQIMKSVGFESVRQYPRASSLQSNLLRCLIEPVRLMFGSSSIVVARKA